MDMNSLPLFWHPAFTVVGKVGSQNEAKQGSLQEVSQC